MFMKKHIYNAGLLFTREEIANLCNWYNRRFLDGTIADEFDEAMCRL